MCTNPNPVVYLQQISVKDLKLILDFIYNGEVNVAKDELDSFLEAADTLKVHGLTSSARNKLLYKQKSRQRILCTGFCKILEATEASCYTFKLIELVT